MKKSILLMAGLAVALASCQKDESISQGPSSSGETSATSRSGMPAQTVPATFIRKVLAEEFVGTTYGDAPMSNSTLSGICSSNNDKVYVASFHNNDALEIGQCDYLKAALPGGTIANYPSSCINRTDLAGSRFVTYSDYNNMCNLNLQTTADCGMTISSSINGEAASITVTSGFTSNMIGNYTMNVYVVENNVLDKSGNLSQANNFTTNKFTPFYQMGNPIAGYTHDNVVRRMVTPIMGKAMNTSSMVAGATMKQSFMIDIGSEWDLSNCYVIAFITKLNGQGCADNICNVQKAQLGSAKGWN